MEPITFCLAAALGSLFVAGGASLNAKGQASVHSKKVSKHVKHSRRAGKDR